MILGDSQYEWSFSVYKCTVNRINPRLGPLPSYMCETIPSDILQSHKIWYNLSRCYPLLYIVILPTKQIPIYLIFLVLGQLETVDSSLSVSVSEVTKNY